MNESQTRFELIDPALRKAGWNENGSKVHTEFPIAPGRLLGRNGRRATALKADYVLEYKNRKLAVIEAKADTEYYTEGVAQAKDYASRLHIRYTYSTNGKQIYFIDMQRGSEGDVDSFPTPDELWNMTFSTPQTKEETAVTNWKDKLLSVPFEDRGGTWQPRYYQDNAINKVIEAVADKKDRILLTLATGTGKTAIAFQIAWKLFQAKWNINRDGKRSPRILFLADRNILADQAFNAFSTFDEDALVRIRPDEIKKKGKVPTNGSVFFTIFQTFMSGPNNSPYFGDYPKDYFDFIIIDECHRGGANDESTWRAIMNYFSPAVQLGLTATPLRDVNKDTYKYFGDPVYTYSLKEGINDGFLTPFRVKQFNTTIDEYIYTDDDEVLEGEIEEGKEYKEDDFNKTIEIMQREEYRVKLMLDAINQNHKTLVFCASQRHALIIRDIINRISESSNPNYCHRVTADDGGLGEQHLRDFQDNEKTIPTILTTSQKLSTGVDAPEIRNIVLFRQVNSMVEFKQIIGRGTRLFFGKDYFTILDFVKAHKHFQDENWDGPPLPPENPVPKPEPQPCPKCGHTPCVCPKEPEPCPKCGNIPCTCEEKPRQIIRVKLSDQKVRELDSMVQTTFWSPDGKQISAEQFIKNLFGDIPSFFQDEEELRKIWSKPDTRRRLLEELESKGYSKVQLEELRKVVSGEDCDLYDVLAYVAYHSNLVPRLERAVKSKVYLEKYDLAQREFLDFVLEQYVNAGYEELDDSKLPHLLELKYSALKDAKIKLGDITRIRETFIGFQEYLYNPIT